MSSDYYESVIVNNIKRYAFVIRSGLFFLAGESKKNQKNPLKFCVAK